MASSLNEWLLSELSDSQIMALVTRGCTIHGSPYARELSRLLKSDPTAALSYGPRAEDYDNAVEYLEDSQLFSLIRKYPWETLSTPEARRERALNEWRRCEIQCRETNIRLMQPTSRWDNGSRWAIIQIAKRKIKNWLGRLPVQQILQEAKFGPGLTLGLDRSSHVGFCDKVACVVTHTRALDPYLDALRYEFPGWASCHGVRWITDDYGDVVAVGSMATERVPGNRVTFVPKNALVDRPIAIEPLLNQFLQLGTGRVLKQRLKRCGLNLFPTQTTGRIEGEGRNKEDYIHAVQSDRHRLLAHMGSLHPWLLATIDMSSASDTVAYRLVEELLPADWFHWLCLLRSPSGILDGETIDYEKFSSMGNGYTFELETLVFCALLHATSEHEGVDLGSDWGVFGDDVILPTQLVKAYTDILTFTGFRVNEAKSFAGPTPFRESCGADYFLGENVRPLYLDHRLTGVDLMDLRSRFAEARMTRVTRFLIGELDRLIPEAAKKRYGVPLGTTGSYRTRNEKYWSDKIQWSDDLQCDVLSSWAVRVGARQRVLRGLAGILHAVETSSLWGGLADLRFSPKLRERRLIDTGVL